MNSQDFGKYIAYLRNESGFKSQRQFSRITGISNATISRTESGEVIPKPETLKEFAKHLKGVRFSDLMEQAGYIEGDSIQEINEKKVMLVGEAFLKDEIGKLVDILLENKEFKKIKQFLEDNNIALNKEKMSGENIKEALYKVSRKDRLYESLLNLVTSLNYKYEQNFKGLLDTSEPSNSSSYNVEERESFYQIIQYINLSHNKTKEHIIIENGLLNQDNGFAILQEDDSLVGDHIFRGDTLICESGHFVTSYIDTTSLYAISVDSKILIRRLFRKGDVLILSSSNQEKYPLEILDRDSVEI